MGLWRAQTPQGFHYKAILAAHESAAAAGRLDLTDDAAVAELAGIAVAIVPGSESNRKLTTTDDLAMANQSQAALPDIRTLRQRTSIGSSFFVEWTCSEMKPLGVMESFKSAAGRCPGGRCRS